jgi:chromosome condensin MukBEF ATPase and DNA-binding subunit MukB
MAERKITAMMIIEVAGRPPEYLVNSLKLHLEKLNHIKDVRLLSTKIAEPRLIDGEKELYTCFGEVEVQVIGLQKLIDLVFDFMPSSIEVLDPIDLELNCQEATMSLNDLAGRLHKYDEIAKIARMQIQQLTQQLQSYQKQIPKETSPYSPIQVSMAPQEKPAKKESPKKKSAKPLQSHKSTKKKK